MKPSFKTALILSAIGVPALFGTRDASAKDKSSGTAAPGGRFAPYVGVWAPTVAACRGGARDVLRHARRAATSKSTLFIRFFWSAPLCS
jgi:hypothetical protein